MIDYIEGVRAGFWEAGYDNGHRVNAHQIAQMRNDIRNKQGVAQNVAMDMWLAQTLEERRTATTIDDNDRGFNQADAPLLTPLAAKLWSGGELTREEDLTVRVHCVKYAAQEKAYLLNGPTWLI